MNEARYFALIVLLTAAVGLVAVLSNRLTERLKIPVPLLVLVAAAVAVKAIPDLNTPPEHTVERILTVALSASCSTAAYTLVRPASGGWLGRSRWSVSSGRS